MGKPFHLPAFKESRPDLLHAGRLPGFGLECGLGSFSSFADVKNVSLGSWGYVASRATFQDAHVGMPLLERRWSSASGVREGSDRSALEVV